MRLQKTLASILDVLALSLTTCSGESQLPGLEVTEATMWEIQAVRTCSPQSSGLWGARACQQPHGSLRPWWTSEKTKVPANALMTIQWETLNQDHPAKLPLSSWPSELWDNKYLCLRLLTLRILYYNTIDNYHEPLSNTGLNCGFFFF